MKIKANKYLFDDWVKLGYKVSILSAMVQNDMEISDKELSDWWKLCQKLSKEISYLADATYKTIEENQ